MYYSFAFDVLRANPINEEKILTAIVDKLCQLDVDIKQAKPCRRYSFFSSLTKIQPMSAFVKEINLRIPSDKEFKMGLLFEKLVEYVKERIIEDNQKETSFFDLL
jgi:succinylglutamate desuccinylase